ncbi:MAG: hypothetical protein LUQ65_13635 [Candidatus Helarchaeota archaeon]|nr:hypothetical protein [Candidatus Helarchaeota archaeon]
MEITTLIDRMSELSNFLNPFRPQPKYCIRFGGQIPKEQLADESPNILISNETKPFEQEADESDKSLPIFPVSDIDSEESEGIGEINPLQVVVNKVINASLPEPYFSNALYRSGLNSPIIHNPNFFVDSAHRDLSAVETEQAQRIRLVEGFDIMSFLEQSLRSFIPEKLKVVHGDLWWERGIPEDVKKGCEERQMKELLKGVSHHFIYYAYIHDYRKIITRNDNWRQSFYMVFDNKLELETCFTWVGNVRNSIAHARPVPDDDYLMFIAGANWIQLRIQRSTGQGSKKRIGLLRKIFG